MRKQIQHFLERSIIRNFILGVILFNAVILGLETSKPIMAHWSGVLHFLDNLCLAIFVAELLAKLYAYGVRFFRDGWNIFDFLIIGIALLPFTQGLAVLRAMRVMRVLRVMNAAPSLRRVVEGFVTALPGMGSVFLLMAVIFYIFSVMATKLFGAAFPEWFGTLGASAYSLFQVMTLESWSMGIVRPVMEQFQYAWAFFVPFILVTTFAVANLVVGLIVNSMQSAHEEEANQATDAYRQEVMDRLKAIETKLNETSHKGGQPRQHSQK